jgi:hypothetical protein
MMKSNLEGMEAWMDQRVLKFDPEAKVSMLLPG